MTSALSPSSFSVNLDSIQAETKQLLKRLRDAEKKVSSSLEDIKQQFSGIIAVRFTLKTAALSSFVVFLMFLRCLCRRSCRRVKLWTSVSLTSTAGRVIWLSICVKTRLSSRWMSSSAPSRPSASSSSEP